MRDNDGGSDSNPGSTLCIYKNVRIDSLSPVKLIYANKNVYKKKEKWARV
jgi:hypothetical protein